MISVQKELLMLPFIQRTQDVFFYLKDCGIISVGRTGGYLTVFGMPHRGRVPLRAGMIGELEADKLESYCGYAHEKGNRLATDILGALAQHPDAAISSWQTRNVEGENEMFGGAIRAGIYILSFSGLPEKEDEALMLVVALSLKLIDRKKAEAIAAISENDVFPMAAEAYLGSDW